MNPIKKTKRYAERHNKRGNMKVVIINCFDTYGSRVELLYNFFLKLGAETIVLTSDFQHIKKEYVNEKKTQYRYVHAVRYSRNLSMNRILSHIMFAKSAICEVEKINPDLLWVLVPPNSLCRQVTKYKEKANKTKVIFDFIDVWPETMPIHKFEKMPFYDIWKNLRQKNLKAADALVVECDYFKSALKTDYDEEKIYTLYLARRFEDYIPFSKPSKDKVEICYLGSINNIVDISLISETLKKIRKPITFHIIGSGEKKGELIDKVTESGVCVIDHGEIYAKEEKQRILQKCHFGINMMKTTVFVGLTMKSIDYLENGLPMLNNIPGDTKRMIEEYGIGINIDRKMLGMEYLELDEKFFDDEIRKKTRDVFEMMFSVEKCEATIERVLEKIDIQQCE